MTPGRLLAVSDLHVSHPRNRQWVADLPPGSPGDWLLVAGDLAEKVEDIEWTLRTLRSRYGTVVWVPGNHELWLTQPRDPDGGSSPAKYRTLVDIARRLGVATPEDAFLRWPPSGEVIVPLCTLYDYSFRPQSMRPVSEYLKLQGRFGHLHAEHVAKLQNFANEQWRMMGVELPEALVRAADSRNLADMASAEQAAAVAQTV